MVEVEILKNSWYGMGTGKEIVFADIEEIDLKSVQIWTRNVGMLDAMRKDSCTLAIVVKDTEGLSKWLQNLWGYVPQERKMAIFECIQIENLNGFWRLEYRIVSILHVHSRSDILLKARFVNAEKKISKYPLLSYIKDVKRHLAEGGRKTMADLICYDHEFMIDLNDLHIEEADLKKISEAWANGYHIYWKAEVFSQSYIKLVVRATRVTPNNIDAKEIVNWKKVEPILKKQEIPDEWVYEVVEIIKRDVI